MKRTDVSVIFDCDGTLLKSLNLGMQAYNIALEKVGARPHEPDEIKRFFGRSADKIFFELLGDREKAGIAYELYLEVERNQVSRIIPHEGIVELLDTLHSMQIRMGVVTGRHARELEFLLSSNGLTKYFDITVCDNELSLPKPHPEGLLKACAGLGVKPSVVYYVGDALMDMQAANGAGAMGIAALWDDWANEELMRSERPMMLARGPREILGLLR